MPGKPPYFRFYVKDFAADDKVEAMTTEQVGAYLLLLCKAWHQEPPGSIPADSTVLARWARLTPERWAEIAPGVLAAFTSGVDDRYHQKRLRAEYAKLSRFLQNRSEAGRAGAEKRWHSQCSSHSTANAQAMLDGNVLNTNSKSSSSKRKKKTATEGFEEFWREYPRKQSKQKALEAWNRLEPGPDLRATLMGALARQKRSAQWKNEEGRYIPYAATWLNQRRWEDEDAPTAETLEEKARRFHKEMQCRTQHQDGTSIGPRPTAGTSDSIPKPTL